MRDNNRAKAPLTNFNKISHCVDVTICPDQSITIEKWTCVLLFLKKQVINQSANTIEGCLLNHIKRFNDNDWTQNDRCEYLFDMSVKC